MPKVALADTLSDWGLLLAAAREHLENKPELKEVLEALQERLDRANQLEAERESLQARRQKATQDLRQVKDEGKDYASRVRSILKSLLGTQNEGLTQFKIRPRRPYGPRKHGVRRTRRAKPQ